MPIETLALGALAATLLQAAEPSADLTGSSHLEYGLTPELTLVGLSGGARAEVLYRLGEPGTASRLRLAPGLLVGPEFTYVPVALGYRAVYRSLKTVRPILGTGLEFQYRNAGGEASALQWAWYLETGLALGLGKHLSVGVVGALDFTFAGGPGAGLSGRLLLGWTP